MRFYDTNSALGKMAHVFNPTVFRADKSLKVPKNVARDLKTHPGKWHILRFLRKDLLNNTVNRCTTTWLDRQHCTISSNCPGRIFRLPTSDAEGHCQIRVFRRVRAWPNDLQKIWPSAAIPLGCFWTSTCYQCYHSSHWRGKYKSSGDNQVIKKLIV